MSKTSKKSAKRLRNLVSRMTANGPIQPAGAARPEGQQRAQMVAVSQELYQGPIPHPDDLRGYEEIVPGSARQIVDMAQTQMTHRQAMEVKITDAQIKDQGNERSQVRLGQILGFVVCVGVLGVSAIIAMHHNTPQGAFAAAGLGGGTMASLVYAFVSGHRGPKADPGKTKTK